MLCSSVMVTTMDVGVGFIVPVKVLMVWSNCAFIRLVWQLLSQASEQYSLSKSISFTAEDRSLQSEVPQVVP